MPIADFLHDFHLMPVLEFIDRKRDWRQDTPWPNKGVFCLPLIEEKLINLLAD